MTEEAGYRENSEKHRGSKRNNSQSSARESAKEILTVKLVKQAKSDQVKLRPYLIAKILFNITNSKSYLFDWTSETLTVTEHKDSQEPSVDCTITLSEDTLIKISNDQINPQIAMLSNKISLSGKVGLAVYVFNLICRG